MKVDIDSESRSRLPPVDRSRLSEQARRDYDDMVRLTAEGRALAGVNGPFGIWIRIPTLGDCVAKTNRYLRTETGLGWMLTELAILATAREMESQFEWTMHEPEAIKAGLTPDTIDIVKHRRDTAVLPEKERAIVDIAREAIGKNKVSSQTYQRANQLFGESVLLNLVALIGNYAMSAIALAVFDQQLRPDQAPLLPRLTQA